jgi:hypothetical protein
MTDFGILDLITNCFGASWRLLPGNAAAKTPIAVGENWGGLETSKSVSGSQLQRESVTGNRLIPG